MYLKILPFNKKDYFNVDYFVKPDYYNATVEKWTRSSLIFNIKDPLLYFNLIEQEYRVVIAKDLDAFHHQKYIFYILKDYEYLGNDSYKIICELDYLYIMKYYYKYTFTATKGLYKNFYYSSDSFNPIYTHFYGLKKPLKEKFLTYHPSRTEGFKTINDTPLRSGIVALTINKNNWLTVDRATYNYDYYFTEFENGTLGPGPAKWISSASSKENLVAFFYSPLLPKIDNWNGGIIQLFFNRKLMSFNDYHNEMGRNTNLLRYYLCFFNQRIDITALDKIYIYLNNEGVFLKLLFLDGEEKHVNISKVIPYWSSGVANMLKTNPLFYEIQAKEDAIRRRNIDNQLINQSMGLFNNLINIGQNVLSGNIIGALSGSAGLVGSTFSLSSNMQNINDQNDIRLMQLKQLELTGNIINGGTFNGDYLYINNNYYNIFVERVTFTPVNSNEIDDYWINLHIMYNRLPNRLSDVKGFISSETAPNWLISACNSILGG